jgi:hypothetical protein
MSAIDSIMPKLIKKQYNAITNKNKYIDHWFWTLSNLGGTS